MGSEKIYSENGKSFVRVFTTDAVEKVNPIEYYRNHEIEKRATLMHDLLYAKSAYMTSMLDSDFFIRKAKEGIDDFFAEFEQTEVHENLIQLLQTTRKKDQEKLLKDMSLNTKVLMSLVMKSYNDFGYLYSKYHFELLPNGLEGKKLPRIFNLNDDGTIMKIGDTDLTDGELKNLINHRKVVVSHFFEKEDTWHCFFLTYKSIAGGETWKNGQAHFHYISSAFGISKEDFVESMRSGNYKSTSIHIDLLDYGNQAEE